MRHTMYTHDHSYTHTLSVKGAGSLGIEQGTWTKMGGKVTHGQGPSVHSEAPIWDTSPEDIQLEPNLGPKTALI